MMKASIGPTAAPVAAKLSMKPAAAAHALTGASLAVLGAKFAPFRSVITPSKSTLTVRSIATAKASNSASSASTPGWWRNDAKR